MTDEGRQTTPEKHIDGQQQVWPYLSVFFVLRTDWGQTGKVARERAGVVQGVGEEVSVMLAHVE